MKTVLPAIAVIAALASAASVSAQALKPELAGLDFLLGRWTGDDGKVAETGGTSRGVSTFTADVGGEVVLRRDHTELRDAKGAPAGGFDQLMPIYAEAGGLHADYFDGSHVIHYVSAEVRPGRSVTFSSAASPGAPQFRLTYALSAPGLLEVRFGLVPPGGAPFQPIATGTLHRAP